MSQRALVLVCVLSLAGAPLLGQSSGQEEAYPVVGSRWNLEMGGMTTSLDTKAAVGFGGTIGTFVDLEDLLGATSRSPARWGERRCYETTRARRSARK